MSNNKLTEPEYIKEVIVRKEKFDDTIENFLDQVDTYDDTKSKKDKLQSIATDLTNLVNKLKEDLGSKIPDGSRQHYNNMINAYELYLKGVELYLNNLPKPLGDDRNNGIKSAEDTFQEAQKQMMNL